jgi:hypothetical protein
MTTQDVTSALRCELIGGSEKLSAETDAADFFSEDAIPELASTRITSAQIRRVFEHHRQRSRPTDFDPDTGAAALI